MRTAVVILFRGGRRRLPFYVRGMGVQPVTSARQTIDRVAPNAWERYDRRMITLADIQQARERIHTVAIHTPLLPAKFGPANVYFKCENLQRRQHFQ